MSLVHVATSFCSQELLAIFACSSASLNSTVLRVHLDFEAEFQKIHGRIQNSGKVKRTPMQDTLCHINNNDSFIVIYLYCLMDCDLLVKISKLVRRRIVLPDDLKT